MMCRLLRHERVRGFVRGLGSVGARPVGKPSGWKRRAGWCPAIPAGRFSCVCPTHDIRAVGWARHASFLRESGRGGNRRFPCDAVWTARVPSSTPAHSSARTGSARRTPHNCPPEEGGSPWADKQLLRAHWKLPRQYRVTNAAAGAHDGKLKRRVGEIFLHAPEDSRWLPYTRLVGKTDTSAFEAFKVIDKAGAATTTRTCGTAMFPYCHQV